MKSIEVVEAVSYGTPKTATVDIVRPVEATCDFFSNDTMRTKRNGCVDESECGVAFLPRPFRSASHREYS